MSSVPWFKNALMNMVLRDLSGWRCEKLTEHSAVLHLNAFTQVICHVQQKRLFMASIHSCEFRVKGTINYPLQGKIRAHQPGWLKRYPVIFTGSKSTAGLISYLNRFPNLQQALSELDIVGLLWFYIIRNGIAALSYGLLAKWFVKCRRCAVICGLSGTSVFFCLV